jgi:hypothetical protein
MYDNKTSRNNSVKKFIFSQNGDGGRESQLLKKDQILEKIESIHQQHQSNRLSMPKKVYKKWDELRDNFDQSQSTLRPRKATTPKPKPRTANSSSIGRSDLSFLKLDQSQQNSIKINLIYSKIERQRNSFDHRNNFDM